MIIQDEKERVDIKQAGANYNILNFLKADKKESVKKDKTQFFFITN